MVQLDGGGRIGRPLHPLPRKQKQKQKKWQRQVQVQLVGQVWERRNGEKAVLLLQPMAPPQMVWVLQLPAGSWLAALQSVPPAVLAAVQE